MTCKDENKVKILNLDCETIELFENLYAYIEYSSSFLKEGQLGAIAWIEHPNLEPSAIFSGDGEGYSFTHPTESHTPVQTGIPNRTPLIRSIH